MQTLISFYAKVENAFFSFRYLDNRFHLALKDIETNINKINKKIAFVQL